MNQHPPERALVVDDQAVSRMLICRYLEEAAIDCQAVATCEEALNALNSSSFDVVLLDVLMPGMGGLELLRILRSRFSLTELPILMVTALTDDDNKRRALEWGANDYISKPIDPQIAIHAVHVHSAMRHQEESLKKQDERWYLAVRGGLEGLWHWDLLLNTCYFSPRFHQILDHSQNSALNAAPQEWFKHIHPADKRRVLQELQTHIKTRTAPFFESSHRLLQDNNTHIWVTVRGQAFYDEEGKPLYMAGSLSESRNSLAYDNATGLLSQQVFMEILNKALAKTNSLPNQKLALLALTPDNLSDLRSRYGGEDYDKIVCELSNRLQISERASDVIFHLNSGVFAVILEDIRDFSDALLIGQRLVNALSKPVDLADSAIKISASAGIALSSSHYLDAERMLADALKALDRALSAGPEQVCLVNDELQKTAQKRLQLIEELRQAQSLQQFILHYQPVFSLPERRIVGLEAFLRWQRDGETTSPHQFLEVCETNDLIRPIGYLTMRQAIMSLASWKEHVPQAQDLYVAFNLSYSQFYDPDLPSNLARFIRESNLPAGSLVLEITDKTCAAQPEEALYIMQRLQKMGVGCALDHFGSEQLTNSAYTGLPLKYVKLSGSLCQDFMRDLHANMAIKINLMCAEQLLLPCLACHVEQPEQSQKLYDMGMYLQQGHLFSHTLPTGAIEPLLQENLAAPDRE